MDLIKFKYSLFLLLITFYQVTLSKEKVECDIFIPGMRMQVNQKISSHVYGAVGVPMGYGQLGRIVYKDLSYARLKIYALDSNSYMESHDSFKYAKKVVGYFNFIGAQKIELESGFKADVLVIKECPYVHELIAKEKREYELAIKKQEEKDRKMRAEEKKRDAKRAQIRKKKKKEFEDLFE